MLSAFIFCRRRKSVERFFNDLKQFRRIVTRYEKFAANYVTMIEIATIHNTRLVTSQ